MIINCDRFFIAELQAAGYDLDFKKVRDIYKLSREKHREEIYKGKIKYRKQEAEVFALMAKLPELDD